MEKNHIEYVLHNRCYIILPDIPVYHYLSDIKFLLDCGIKLFQIRRKNIAFNDYLKESLLVNNIIKTNDGYLIINDSVKICMEANADGVHLGENDMDPSLAREILGDEKIIGFTANSYDNARFGFISGVDYIGLGPFFFTKTKNKLKPFVKTNTVKKILDNIPLPIFAIGGINEKNIYEILNIGINKIAISSAFFKAKDKVYIINKILGALYGKKQLQICK